MEVEIAGSTLLCTSLARQYMRYSISARPKGQQTPWHHLCRRCLEHLVIEPLAFWGLPSTDYYTDRNTSLSAHMYHLHVMLTFYTQPEEGECKTSTLCCPRLSPSLYLLAAPFRRLRVTRTRFCQVKKLVAGAPIKRVMEVTHTRITMAVNPEHGMWPHSRRIFFSGSLLARTEAKRAVKAIVMGPAFNTRAEVGNHSGVFIPN